MGNEKFAKSREGSEVREFPSHHCQLGFLLNPGIICRLNLLWVLVFDLEFDLEKVAEPDPINVLCKIASIMCQFVIAIKRKSSSSSSSSRRCIFGYPTECKGLIAS